MVLGLASCADGLHSPAGNHDGGEGSAAYQREIEQWRVERMARLKAPEGWLSYTGSGRLLPGSHRVGSAADNSIRLPAGPARLGVLQLAADGEAIMEFSRDSRATINGEEVARAMLQPATTAASAGSVRATRVAVGSGIFYLVRTGELGAWRYLETDPANRPPPGRMEYYALDPSWRVVASWEAYETPKEVVLLTSIGTPQTAHIPGEASFEWDGQTLRLQPVLLQEPGAPDSLFFLFSDRTSGRKTYGGGRYLFADMPADGRLVLDFNRAQNPPCAITPHVVCPLGPPSNRLEVAVTAGEQNYLPGS
jgi:uncharacterized protein (DUF1684 family)